jgi:glycosyltransferase involved in cell wall biosynthesis
MPRLLIACTIYETARAFLLPFSRHFRALGWRVDAAARGISRWHAALDEFDAVHDIGWSRSPTDPRNFLNAAPSIQRAVQSGAYDIVHVHTPVAAFVTRAALRSRRPPAGPFLVYTAHGFHFHPSGSPVSNAVFRALETLAARWTDHLILINREDESEARRLRLLPDSRISYIPGIGVDTSALRPETVPAESIARLRSELGLSPHQPLLLMIASFDKGKRHADLLNSFARLNRRDAVLALAGVGPLLDSMRDLARSLGVADRVRFLGYRGDIPILIRASAATILTSEREGLSRSVLESLSLEVPVIGTNARGVGELLQTGGGVEIQIGDVPALTQAMAALLADPDLASAMGRRGRAALSPYEQQAVIRRHEAIYGQLLGNAIHSEVACAQAV